MMNATQIYIKESPQLQNNNTMTPELEQREHASCHTLVSDAYDV